jgi:hypothetical protein
VFPRRAMQVVAWVWIAGVSALLVALLGLGLVRWAPVVSAILWLRLAAWASVLPATVAVLALLASLLPRGLRLGYADESPLTQT